MKTINLLILSVLFIFSWSNYQPSISTSSKPVKNIWTAISDIPTPRYGPGVVELDGKIYVMGGIEPKTYKVLTVVEVFDIKTSQWSTKASLPEPNNAFGIVVLDGKIFIAGGVINDNISNKLWEYDPGKDSWAPKANMLNGRKQISAVAFNNNIYTFGGDNLKGSNSAYVFEIYDVATDKWTIKPSMRMPFRNAGIAVLNGNIYIVGGQKMDKKNNGNALWEYFPAVDKWYPQKDMPTARTDMATTECKGKMYVIGGSPGMPTIDSYDAVKEKWSEKTAMPTGRCFHGAISFEGKIYVVGGTENKLLVYNPDAD